MVVCDWRVVVCDWRLSGVRSGEWWCEEWRAVVCEWRAV